VSLRNVWYALLVVPLIVLLSTSIAFAQTVGSDVVVKGTAVDETAVETGFITEAEISQAIQKLQNDPNLAGERKTRVLKWNETKKEEEPKSNQSMPRWLRWIGDLFKWLGESARVLVWTVVALFVALLVVWLIRIVRGSDVRLGSAVGFRAPTHVRDLDIRPESLPDDIGRSALELWERGEHRAALSLLYRGMLSRLVHSHAVPIKHSSTEGECRLLALQRLPVRSHEYLTLLIRVWQGAVYGATEPGDEIMRRLCAQFAATLNADSPVGVTTRPSGVSA
jgi:hypothetical protein